MTRKITADNVTMLRTKKKTPMLTMAGAGRGNAYYGQTAADLAEPFAAEFALLTSLCARGLMLKVQAPDDVAELLRGFTGAPRSRLREALASGDGGGGVAGDETSADLAALLTTAPVAVDELVRQSGTAPGSVQMALLELELAGRLERHAGGRVSLKAIP